MTDASRAALRRTELTTTGSLAAIFALRMFGLFMLLPVFAVYGAELDGATPLLIGTAIARPLTPPLPSASLTRTPLLGPSPNHSLPTQQVQTSRRLCRSSHCP